ncbi:MAG: MGMT family protein [Clostridiales bacterium]|nr:MGMT family protein [Clostridiales bacterium]
MNAFFEKVFWAVRRIPAGKVVTYGQIALAIGYPRSSRAVGSTLRKNPHPGEYPCHRVVNSKGSLAPNFAFGGYEVQKMLLENEGVTVSTAGKVSLEKFSYRFVDSLMD